MSTDDLESQISHLSDDDETSLHHHSPDKYFRQTTDNNLSSATTANRNNAQRDDESLHMIRTSGSSNEYIHIDNKKYLRADLVRAFGGSLEPGTYQTRTEYKFANPAPLGLSAFALTTFVLSLINVQARSVATPNIVVGLAMFYGGLVQLLAGMWEIALGNAFGGTSLSSFGGFWLSFGAIYIKWFGIIDAYDTVEELENAVGFYLLGWFIFTFGITLLTLKSTLMFFSLFFTLTITFLLLAVGKLANSVSTTKAAGVIGLICAFIAFYNAFAGLATPENSYFTAHVVRLPENIFKKKKKN